MHEDQSVTMEGEQKIWGILSSSFLLLHALTSPFHSYQGHNFRDYSKAGDLMEENMKKTEGRLPGAAALKKTDSNSPNIHYLLMVTKLQIGLHLPSLSHTGIWMGLVFNRSFVCNHTQCEFNCVVALLWLENTISLQSSTLTIFSALPSSPMIPEHCMKSVWRKYPMYGRAIHSLFFKCCWLLFKCMHICLC